MSYEDALADLKADFGKQKMLTPAEIAPYIKRSGNAQAAMRSRKRFPIPNKELGGRIVVSIYALAHYIGDELEADAEQPASERPSAPRKARASKTADSKSNTSRQAFRRAPSLGKTLLALRKQIDGLELQLRFQNELFNRLEEIELRSDPPKQSKAPRGPNKPKRPPL